MEKKLVQETVLYFISHASVLFRFGDEYLLTDPWYLTPAFSSWTPIPPPVVNLSVLEALSKTGRLTVLISHAHPDHTDVQFLKKLDETTPIIIPLYEDDHFIRYLKEDGFQNVREVGDAGLESGAFKINRLIHHISRHDALLTIETNDAFIVHGNDSWVLGGGNVEKLEAIKPKGKPSLFMGQGGSASGYPLTYLNYNQSKKIERLKEKNEKMINGLSSIARSLQFDRVLAYACFVRVMVGDKNYSEKAQVSDGVFCREITGNSSFIDFSPGDIYLPAEMRIIPVLSTLKIPLDYFSNEILPVSFKEVDREVFMSTYQVKASSFFDEMNVYFQQLVDEGRVNANSFSLVFDVEVCVDNEIIWSYQMECPGPQNSSRKKLCRISPTVLSSILDRIIPFEDAYTGYLAEWKRTPEDHYNEEFIREMINFGYIYMNQK